MDGEEFGRMILDEKLLSDLKFIHWTLCVRFDVLGLTSSSITLPSVTPWYERFHPSNLDCVEQIRLLLLDLDVLAGVLV